MSANERMRFYIKQTDGLDETATKNASCLLTISAGKEIQEGESFLATVRLINQEFASCTIALNDTLQRYTIALDKPGEPDDYYAAAVAIGDGWLARNEIFCNYLENLTEIIRWDYWLADPDYAVKKEVVLAMLKMNPDYQVAFDATMQEYLTRYRRRLENPNTFDEQRAKRLCFDYLVEECTAMCLWPKGGYQFELYATKHNPAMEMTRELLIRPIYPDLLRGIQTGSNVKRKLKPQKLETLSSEVQVAA